jgi:hypothetical protein
MDEDPIREYRRWQELEEAGRDEDADRAFEGVFKASATGVPVSHDFTARTMAAVAGAVEHDVRRARRVRRVALVSAIGSGAAAIYFGAGYALAAMSSVFVRLIDLLIVGVVYVVGAMQSGVDLWSLAVSVGRAAAAVAGDPRVAIALVMIQGVAIAAFVALRRLLDSDGELLK